MRFDKSSWEWCGGELARRYGDVLYREAKVVEEKTAILYAIGDWVRMARREWGSAVALAAAAELTNLDQHTLESVASVAESIPVLRRVYDKPLPFWTQAAAAPLRPEQQINLLSNAADAGWTRDTVRVHAQVMKTIQDNDDVPVLPARHDRKGAAPDAPSVVTELYNALIEAITEARDYMEPDWYDWHYSNAQRILKGGGHALNTDTPRRPD
jgi:hypothetical protein